MRLALHQASFVLVTIAILLCGLITQIVGCASVSKSCTYWRPVGNIAGTYSNQDGVARFEFRHHDGVKFTLCITGPGQGKVFNFFGEFLVPKNITIKLAEREFEVRIPGGSLVAVKIENLVILDESLNRTVAIPADREIISSSKLALTEDLRHKYCSFTSNSFQTSTETMEIKVPTINVNGANWVLPKLLIEKHTGEVSRSFSP